MRMDGWLLKDDCVRGMKGARKRVRAEMKSRAGRAEAAGVEGRRAGRRAGTMTVDTMGDCEGARHNRQ